MRPIWVWHKLYLAPGDTNLNRMGFMITSSHSGKEPALTRRPPEIKHKSGKKNCFCYNYFLKCTQKDT